MKRLGAILTLVALMITLSASYCFAGSLTIEETYPKDGSTGASIENLGVKIYFSQDMTESIVGEANADAFQLYDDEGNKLPTIVLYNEKEEGVVLVLLDSTSEDTVTVKGNTEYSLKISGDLVDDNGDILGEDETITFKTLNQNTNTLISVGMMVVMFGGMIIISSKSAKKAAEEEANRRREEKVNPYKEAKKTGKSVEEIVEKDQKRKAKIAEKEARKAAKEAEEYDYYDDDEDDINRYKVHRRHSAAEAGSKYVAEKKEEAKAEKAKKGAASHSKKK